MCCSDNERDADINCSFSSYFADGLSDLMYF